MSRAPMTASRRTVVCLQVFRFVRHLPIAQRRSWQPSGLRAGVGQTSREETAGHAAVFVEGTPAMAIGGWGPADASRWAAC